MNRIKELRNLHGIKQNDLCSQIDVSQGTLSGWENGKYEPDLKSINKMCDIFDITTDYLLGRTNNIRCEFCDYEYDPLSEFETKYKFHEKHHQKCLDILIKYGFYYHFSKREEIIRKSEDIIFKVYDHSPSDDDIFNACINRIHAFFCQDIETHNYNLKNLSLKEKAKEYLTNEKIYQEFIPHNIFLLLLKHFNLSEEDLYNAKTTEPSAKDIKKDLDSLVEKLSSEEYPSTTYDGKNIPKDEQIFFAGQLKLMEHRLKSLTKERENPDNIISIIKEPESDYLAPDAAHKLPNASPEDKQYDEDIMNDDNF